MIISIFMHQEFILLKCHPFIDQSIDIFSLIFYLVVIRFVITKNLVVKIKKFIVNHESRLVKSNHEVLLVVTVRHRYSKMQDFSVPHSDVV